MWWAGGRGYRARGLCGQCGRRARSPVCEQRGLWPELPRPVLLGGDLHTHTHTYPLIHLHITSPKTNHH